MFDNEGRPKQIAELAGAEAEAIAAFERIEQYDEAGGVKRAGYRVRYISRLHAYALLGKALGYYESDNKRKGSGHLNTAASSATINILPVSISPTEAYRQIGGRPSSKGS
jgi:hypothetical protein